MPGTLFLIGTPIGNLGDITLRAIEMLKTVDVVACEDTRRTDILLRHLQINKPVLRYDEYAHERSARHILERLSQGQAVALVSDAGTPAVSDPGARLVKEAVSAGHRVIPIPGPSAVTAAVSAAGFPSEGFVFLGFLPRRPGRAQRVLQEAFGLGKTTVIFESPFRAQNTLKLVETLNPDANVVVVRELTKIHEEFIRGSVQHVQNELKNRPEKGEITVIISPAKDPK